MDGGALRFAIGAWVAVAGAVIGSFLNVVVARVPQGESIAWPGSRCPACRAPIAWYDNVPVLSWLVLRGRCRRCAAPIAFRYVALELAGAAAAWLAWSRHGLSLAAVAELALVDTLLALAFIDLATWLLPNALTWPLIVAGLAAGWAGAAPSGSLSAAALGAAVGFGAFGVVRVVGQLVTGREALGLGDVWLLAGFGAWVGAPGLVPVVLLASVQGSVYGVALIALGRGEPGPAAAPPPDPTATSQPSAVPEPTAAPQPAQETAPTAATTPDRPTAPAAPPPPDEDWVPPRNAVPFGPWLVAGALEWLYLGGSLASVAPALRLFR